MIEAIRKLNSKGGTIYIDTPVITITNKTIILQGTSSRGILGVRQSNGEYPRITFINSKALKGATGILIYGSNKFINRIYYH